jgi:hypothetical protein
MSVGKCEGMNLHILKRTPTLGIGVPMDSRIFRKQLQESKLIGLKSSLFHWKALGTWMSKMSSHDPFGYLKHKLTKVRNCPNLLACKWRATYRWKAFDKAYNFALNLI